ncbi:anti-sigma factor [Halalkalibacter sp. APA_J-10(15)]|uniref:anti-sigma factor family protein n=1 Tax=Halalkalibacter sp. APA_J-10(15) TaxID=2933805 RepID=UPI001FF58F2C|nr:anti-sigma factor [Halalkalibacter sp. APA_J-10(15)]MCK0473767.1 anti-sigma factor [Halalkalibacter sp. APA_J-10(15)]
MTCEKQYDKLIQAYLDEEITSEERKQLNEHLAECEECRRRVQELKKTIAFVQSSSHIAAPSNFTSAVMNQLPERKQTSKWKQWTRRHPVIVAAAVFFLLMAMSLSTMWNDENELVVRGSSQLSINQENGVVIVPEGEVIEGDLTIQNGKLQIDGEIQGNVLLINSETYYASAGHVSGDIHEVDQALEWIWYHTKKFFKDVIAITNGEK